MKVIVKEPNRRSEYREIDDTLEAMQEIVGGYIECVFLGEDTVMVCNEEGKLMGMQMNFPFRGDSIVGTIFVCGTDDEGDFTDVPITLEEWEEIINE